MGYREDTSILGNNLKMKIYSCKDEIYKFNFEVVISKWDEFRDFIKNEFKKDLEINSLSNGMFLDVDENDDYFFFVWFKEDVEVHTIVHEAFHLITFILLDKGIKLSRDCDEAYAYLLDYWFRQIKVIVDKYQKKGVKKK